MREQRSVPLRISLLGVGIPLIGLGLFLIYYWLAWLNH
jgi:hypothetical protein